MTDTRYTLAPDALPKCWVVKDELTGIRIRFVEHQFNDTQEVIVPDDYPIDASAIAHDLQEMGAWLAENCRSII